MIRSNKREALHSRQSFRLLNSEIGNDHNTETAKKLGDFCFRLLNSEIGNDLNMENQVFNVMISVFVSLTRR